MCIVNARPYGRAFFNNYHPYAAHLRFMRKAAAQNPGRAEVFTVGKTSQGQEITGIHFWGTGGKGSRPAIIFHATTHAREWITTMTVQYFSWYLLSHYTINAEIKAYVDKYDFYIFPVVNPDGMLLVYFLSFPSPPPPIPFNTNGLYRFRLFPNWFYPTSLEEEPSRQL